MSKRSLMLSTAAVALLTSAALADTTIDASKTEPYTTGALLTSTDSGQANAGNITVKSGGSVTVSAAQGALTVTSNSWILQQASVTNKDKDAGSAIHVDLSTDRDLSGATFVNAASATINGTGIYLDSGSYTTTSGSNSGRYGIFIDSAGCSTSCTYKGGSNGAIVIATGSSLSVAGDKSAAIQFGSASSGTGVIQGDLIIDGAVTAVSSTTNQTATGMYGLVSYGKIDGNVVLGGTMASTGQGAIGMDIQGTGVTKSIVINGSLTSTIPNTNNSYNYYSKINTTTNPEAGPAMAIRASVGGGIYINGPTTSGGSRTSASVATQGNADTTGPAISITPSGNYTVVTPTSSMVIGVYTADTANPGFSFYNRGTVTEASTNYSKSTAAMGIAGYSSTLPTVLTGGLFNSGSMTTSTVTQGTKIDTTGITSSGLLIGSNVELLLGSGKNTPTSTDPGNQAALVNSGAAGGGTISAQISGQWGGTAQAVVMQAGAIVPSIINTGTISASATTVDATIGGNTSGSSNPLIAYGIQDFSGSVTSIYNAGTISAVAGYQPTSTSSSSNPISALDNNSQIAIAISLNGTSTSASASGVTIQNYSSTSRAATIVGNIDFGTGNNQILDLLGVGPTLPSTITGNVTYGMAATTTSGASGDRLIIGSYSALSGSVTTNETVRGYGVQVDVDTHGILTLLNTASSLNSTAFNVATGGTVNLGVNRSLTSTSSGAVSATALGIVSAQTVNFASDATLNVTYTSYLPQSSSQFVLMTADKGQLSISQLVLDKFNSTSNRPFLLQAATLCNTGLGNCSRPADLPSSEDALVINVTPKTPAQIGLTANSVAITAITTDKGASSTLFEQANLALGVDDALGSAMLNGVHNAAEAQRAYNNFAPNITGGTRAIAISITDSATGPVAARQRALRMYDKAGGNMTLWGQEFVQMLKDPGSGAIDANTGFKTNPGFKDHGFGFSLGVDAGSSKYGWYGGALTFYSGDVNELSRVSHENQQWYLLTLYSSWRGKGLFIDTKVDAGYGHVDGKRGILLQLSPTQYYARTAENKHAGALLSGSVGTGAMFSYGAATLMPQLSVDGLFLHEEGYTEHNPGTTTVGDGFDLTVKQSNAKSLRAFVGLDARYDLSLWDFFLQPELRAGYRYDLLSDPLKVKAAFAYADTTGPTPVAGNYFTLTGPDPAQGNYVLGGSIATTTDTWTLGLNFDLVKGSNGAFQQVGTVHLLGRI